MSTTLLHQSFGIHGYQQTRIELNGGVTRFHVEPGEKSIDCPSCDSSNVIRRGLKQRVFRASPIGFCIAISRPAGTVRPYVGSRVETKYKAVAFDAGDLHTIGVVQRGPEQHQLANSGIS